MILLGISFISVELTSNLTMILILFLLLVQIFKLIKKMIKKMKTDTKSNYLKEEKQSNHDENKGSYNDTLSTNKEDTIPNNIIKEEPKRKPLFSYADIENLYKHYSLEELEEEINETQDETKSDIEYIEVVGTKYTDAYYILSNAIRDRGEVWDVNGYQYHDIVLTLQAEPDNQYDPNAILVTYENEKIGHLPKEVAARTKLTKPLKVKAIIKEGFKNMYIKIPMKNKTTKN